MYIKRNAIIGFKTKDVAGVFPFTVWNGEEYIDLAVDKKDTEFISFISNIDKTHIDAISRQSNAWFGKEWTKNAVDSLYTSVLSLHKDIGFVIRVTFSSKIPVTSLHTNYY